MEYFEEREYRHVIGLHPDEIVDEILKPSNIDALRQIFSDYLLTEHTRHFHKAIDIEIEAAIETVHENHDDDEEIEDEGEY
jgi:hypothetical protein